MSRKPHPVHTIGHSDLDREKLIDRLEKVGVELVVDVRSTPHSRHAPQFNQKELAEALGQRGIGYIHMGTELGGRPKDDRLYDEQNRADYRLMALEPKFEDGIRQLAQTATDRRMALLCTERDPLQCHRALLVAPALERAGVPIVHLTGDGRSVSHGELMRLLTMSSGPPRLDDPRMTEGQMVERAVENQARRVAYRRH